MVAYSLILSSLQHAPDLLLVPGIEKHPIKDSSVSSKDAVLALKPVPVSTELQCKNDTAGALNDKFPTRVWLGLGWGKVAGRQEVGWDGGRADIGVYWTREGGGDGCRLCHRLQCSLRR